MSGKMENCNRYSKLAASHISKFKYHFEHTLPDLLTLQQSSQQKGKRPLVNIKKGLRNLNFHFAEHAAEGVGAIDAEAILLSAVKIYVGSDCVKISEHTYKKNTSVRASYMPIYGSFPEIIEFCLLDLNEDRPQSTFSRWAKGHKSTSSTIKDSSLDSSCLKSSLKKINPNNY
jgi:hypothetical protein